MNREDFPLLQENIIYFDNAATTLKPTIVTKSTEDYYLRYPSNIHRGYYDISVIADSKYEDTRTLVKNFIGASDKSEIIFTSGTTDSMNKVIFGFFKHQLKAGDEVLLTRSEHASNVLPWFELAEEIGLVISYIELDENFKVTLRNVRKAITPKTKVISIAHITNVIGDIRPVAEIVKLANDHQIFTLIDGAQSSAHMNIDVVELDIDFLAFSAHKMTGPTGVGVLYGKKKWLEMTKPLLYGGGMNDSFAANGAKQYLEIPYRLEAGTPNIAGIIAFGDTLRYLNQIGMNHIYQHEKNLRYYLVKRLREMEHVIIYNCESESGIVTINVEKIPPQVLATYLNHYKICVRTGSHCAKILDMGLGLQNTCRISLYFYNTTAEIDYFIEILKKIDENTIREFSKE